MWFFSAIIAKIASAGAVAQAATGAGLVLVGFTTAGATGVLPTPVQNTFDSVVHDVSGPNTAGATTSGTPSETATPSPTDTSVTSSSAAPSETHAAVVSTGPSWKPERGDGEDGEKNYGQAVSSAAHERNDEREAERTASATARPTPTEPAASGDDQDHGSASAAKSRHGDD